MDGWILIIFVKNVIKTNKKTHTDDVEVSKTHVLNMIHWALKD